MTCHCLLLCCKLFSPRDCKAQHRSHLTACLLHFLVFITRYAEKLQSYIACFTYIAKTIGINKIFSNYMFSPHPNWIWYHIAIKRFLLFELVIPVWKIHPMEIILKRERGICSETLILCSLWGPKVGNHSKY